MSPRPSSAEMERMVDFIAALELLQGRFTELVAQLRGMAVNDVLFSGTVTLDPAGQWSGDWPVPFGAVAVVNDTSADITVAAAAPQQDAPTHGPGVELVAAGTFQTIPLTGRVVTVYGAAGERLALAVTAKVLPPAAAAIGPGAMIAPGTMSAGVQTAVAGVAVQVLAANSARRGALIHNIGANPIRVGGAGVTNVTGFARLAANERLELAPPFIPDDAIFAIREGGAGTDSTVLAAEVT